MNEESHLSVTGNLTHKQYDEDGTALYFAFSDMSQKLDDNNFIGATAGASVSMQYTNLKSVDALESLKIG